MIYDDNVHSRCKRYGRFCHDEDGTFVANYILSSEWNVIDKRSHNYARTGTNILTNNHC